MKTFLRRIEGEGLGGALHTRNFTCLSMLFEDFLLGERTPPNVIQ